MQAGASAARLTLATPAPHEYIAAGTEDKGRVRSCHIDPVRRKLLEERLGRLLGCLRRGGAQQTRPSALSMQYQVPQLFMDQG